MSVRYAIEVNCDGPKSGGGCPDNRAWADYGTATDLRVRMRDDGWLCGAQFGIDRCPACREEGSTDGR